MANSRFSLKALASLLLMLIPALLPCTTAASSIFVEALFPKRVVVNIDGQRRVLNVGERSPEGLRLLAADSEKARFERAGKEFQLGLDQRVGSTFKAPPEGRKITLVESPDGQFYVDGTLNGSSIRFLVDTGASTVALNSRDAERLGLLPRFEGAAMSVETASGRAPAYALTLRTVQAQSIRINGVEAVVIEGDFPKVALLGQSFLRHLEMTRNGPLLELRQR